MSSYNWPTTGGGGGNQITLYTTYSAFPTSGVSANSLALAEDTGTIYEYISGAWKPVAGNGAMLGIGTIDSSTPSANGAVDSSGQLILQSASASNPGLVNTGAQTFTGSKSFAGSILGATDGTYSIGSPTNRFLNVYASNDIYVGVTPASSGNPRAVLTADLASGPSAGLLLYSGSTQQYQLYTDGLGINIGNLGAGSTQFICRDNNFVFQNATPVNYLTGSASGIVSTSNFSAPQFNVVGTTSGAITVEGQAASGTYNFNLPTTAGTAGYALTSQGGGTNAMTWTQFQASGNYITALTGDATAAGPGSAAVTLATVNSNTGAFGSSTAIPTLTLNAKGLVTAASTSAVVAPAGTLSGTALNSTVVGSSLTSVGSLSSGTWNATTIATAHGGTGATSVTTSPAASAFAGWDANKNITANNLIAQSTSTATAAGTTTLTVSSTEMQVFTGSTTQTIVLPVATTLQAGQGFIIVNQSTGALTVNTSGSNLLVTVGANQTAFVNCSNTAGGTGTASWAYTLSATTVFSNPMSAIGQLIYGGTGGTPTALGVGTTGQVLQSNASAAPSWATLTAPTKQVFTTGTSATYTTPSGAKWLKVTCVGGGGGGGGVSAVATTAAQGGGGGGTAIKWISSPNSTYAYSVGSGGTAGTSGGGNGSAGGATTFGSSFITASGGFGGSGDTTNRTAAVFTNVPTSGGGASGGDINIAGGYSVTGYVLAPSQALGGQGGSSTMGPGGPSPVNTQSSTSGLGYGDGGSGASSVSSVARAGGAGANGIIIVEEYYQ